MICRARPTASDHCGNGSTCVTDGALCGCGCRGVAVARMYGGSPTINASSPPTVRTMPAVQVLSRILFFDMFSFASQSVGAALNPASDAPRAMPRLCKT